MAVAAVVVVVGALVACDPLPVPEPGRTAGALGAPPGHVALTFDDGPDPRWTPQVLDILDRHGVKGTFFVTGDQVARHPHLAAAIVQRGHSLANHTWGHPDLTRLPAPAVRDQLAGTSAVIRDVTGYRVSCARPPYGATNSFVNDTIASLDMRPALWSVDTRDWARPGVAAIVAVAASAPPDSVVLLHDGGGDRSQTVAALPEVITRLQAAGHTLSRACDSRPTS